MRRACLLALIVAALLGSAGSAHAADVPLVPETPCVTGEQPDARVVRSRDPDDVALDGTVVVSPDRIESTGVVAPGTVLTCTITLRSRHRSAGTFELVPFGVLGGGDASVHWVGPDDEEAGATAVGWLTPLVDEIRLAPREVARIPVVVRVPDAPPTAAAYASINVVSRAREQAGETRLGIESQVGVPVLLQTTPEGAPRFRARDVSAPRLRLDRASWTLTARVVNVGTMHGTPSGVVRVRSIFGNEVARLPASGRPLLPEAAGPLQVTWRGVPWFGIYRTQLQVTTLGVDGGATSTTDGWFVALPPWWVLALVAAALAAWLLARVVRRGRARGDAAFDDDVDWDSDSDSDSISPDRTAT